MLEEYFVKPETVDRIRASWIGPQIEQYVAWLAGEGYRPRRVLHRVPMLLGFAGSPGARCPDRGGPARPCRGLRRQ